MLENYLILSYFCIIVIFQSIIGVGVLVLGTPFLLILKFNIIETFFILLPISIITSLLNLLIINFSRKSFDKSTYAEFKKFFVICIPSIFIGLILLKLLNNYLNFKFLVAFVILFSITLIKFKDKIKLRINFFRISILSIVGIIHGLTNSGGTLMSLALSANNKKNYARLNTSFFYFILAMFQYFLTTIIFYDSFIFPNNFKVVLTIIIGVILGNLINYYVESKTYKTIVYSLSFISALILVTV
tara:strand:+ start:377 stop:1108 length:732 start_codon:yes stop_codon:yes gene_type:complete